jgi:hypothetical protein
MNAAPTRPVQPGVRPPSAAGPKRFAKMWLDAKGLPHTSEEPVPVDDNDRRTGHVKYVCPNGQIEVRIDGGPEWEKRPCDFVKWVLPGDKPGFCPDHGREELKPAEDVKDRIPFGKVVAAAEESFRPWWLLAAEAGAGIALHAADIPAVAPAVATPLLAAAGYATSRSYLLRRAVKRGRMDKGQRSGRRYRLVQRRARFASWLAGASGAWLSAAAVADPSSLAGKVIWASLPVAWAVGAVPWWRRVEARRNFTPPVVFEPEVVEVEPVEPVLSDDERDAAAAAQAWQVEVGAADTVLDVGTWKRIPCGWQAVIRATKRGALVRLSNGDMRGFTARVAAAYDVPRSAITWVDEHDENPNLAMLYVQPVNPLKDGQIWAGPDSIRITESRIIADVGRFIDGSPMLETLFRFDEGMPSELVLGTTGSGKSERLRSSLLVQRWASYEDATTGERKGLFLSFLHDPKRLNSYGEFRNAVHAYGITRDDAHIMIDAFLREMIRRYDMLSAIVWFDDKGRRRVGSVKWDPRIHGPLLKVIWDEFHELAGDQEFVKKLEKLARYIRACGMGNVLASHMGTIGDTGSQALRDMLAGGRATLLRTTSGLNAPLATGGQLTGDPRALPKLGGMAYVADGESMALMGRYAFVPDDKQGARMGVRPVYDWLFDDNNQPIGYPAEIPADTAEAFGPEFMEWMAAGRSDRGREGWVYSATPAFVPTEDRSAQDALLAILAKAEGSLQRKDIYEDPLWGDRGRTSTLTKAIRDCLDADPPLVVKRTVGKETSYELSPAHRAKIGEVRQEAEQESLFESEVAA